MSRRPRRRCRAGFLTAGKGPTKLFCQIRLLMHLMNQDQPSEGLFTEGTFALVEGDYTENATLAVIAIGHPPCESRETAR
jgi:hypothetical protein